MEVLIKQLRDKGIRLEVQGRSLRVHAPKGALTPEVRELLRKHSAELARELRRSDRDTSPLDISANSEGERISVEQLVELIRGQLENRPLPICVTSGETIVDLDRYAQAEARGILFGCSLEAEAARARLVRLGISDF